MSFSISPNESGIPRAKNSASKPSSRASYTPNRSAVNNTLNPSPSNVSGDQVRFGNRGEKKAGVEHVREAEAPQSATSDTSSHPNGKPGEKSQRNYGHKENNIREAARIVLCDIAPLALSVLPLVGIPGVGFVFAVATLPMSYLSGKLGRHVAKDVNTEDLNPAFQYIHKVRHALTHSPGKDGNVVDNINKATDDLLNVRNMPAILTSTVLPMLKVKQGSWAAKALTKMNSVALMRAEVNIRLAQAENGKDAGKAMFNGVKDFALYSAMNKMGTAMVASSLPGAKWAGEFLKNAAWVKIAADLLHTREAEKKPAPA